MIVASEPEILKALRQLVTILLSISIHVDERTSAQVAFEPDIVEFWSAILSEVSMDTMGPGVALAISIPSIMI